MKILLIVLAVLAALLVLLLLLLLLGSAGIRIIYRGQLRVVLKVLGLRYGLYRGKEHTQREIASVMGISRSYVSRIEKRAIEKVRAELKHS